MIFAGLCVLTCYMHDTCDYDVHEYKNAVSDLIDVHRSLVAAAPAPCSNVIVGDFNITLPEIEGCAGDLGLGYDWGAGGVLERKVALAETMRKLRGRAGSAYLEEGRLPFTRVSHSSGLQKTLDYAFCSTNLEAKVLLHSR
eukprot:9443598-Pyramimonas_sp.AAC.1